MLWFFWVHSMEGGREGGREGGWDEGRCEVGARWVQR